MVKALFLEIVAATGANAKSPAAELPRQGKLVVGAHPERASFVVEGQGVADVHCAIGRIKGGGWALKDLGSEFGTRVNGERIETARLVAGDEILIGSRKLRVFDPSKEPARRDPKSGDAASGDAASGDAASGNAASGNAESGNPGPPASAPRPASKGGSETGRPGKAVRAVPAQKPEVAEAVELAGYRIERPLGRGAMGDVFLATQTSLDRKVALKVLRRELGKDATFVDRFRDEARAAARLNHPNVVTVYDVGTDKGRHYLSMEFMDGESVESRLTSGGPLPWREALDVVRDAAAGLVYAETSGIVHRDIKPDNLMRNREGVTKIADLGLAAQVEQEGVETEALGGGAGAAKVFGTPHFIAPEVVRGAPADARSDMFSLGATAYRVLSGRTPFEGATTRDILKSLLNDDPPRLGSLVPGLPAGFEAVVHRLLAKSPEDRFASAAILLRELERLRQSDGRDGGLGSAATAGAGTSSGALKPALIGAAVIAVVAVVVLVLRGGGDEPEGDGFEGFPSRGDGSSVTDGAGATGDGPDAGAGAASPGGAADGSGGVAAGDPGAASVAASDGARSGPGSGSDLGAGTGGPAVAGAGGATRGADEAEFEYKARLAYLALGDEALNSQDRAARLRALGEAYAGTDIATEALAEADQLESGVIQAERAEAAQIALRTETLAALRAAAELDSTPFHPGTALRAMRLVPVPDELAADASFSAQRRELVDEVLEKGLERGEAAWTAADEGESLGDFRRTEEALRDFIGATDLPTAEEAPRLVGDTAPPSLEAFTALAAKVRERLASMAGREAEYEAERKKRERISVGRTLGTRLEASLASLDVEAAADSVRAAAELLSDPTLAERMRGSAADLAHAQSAITALLASWDAPGWRRRNVFDPRVPGGESVSAVGVATNAILLETAAGPERVPLSAWAGQTRELRALFYRRLDRDWTLEESRGIATLLTVSATLEALEALSPALATAGKRVGREGAEDALKAFEEALEWASEVEENAGLQPLVDRHREAVAQLGVALVARESGDWSTSTEMLRRLLDEQRDTWLVMLLSDGGKR